MQSLLFFSNGIPYAGLYQLDLIKEFYDRVDFAVLLLNFLRVELNILMEDTGYLLLIASQSEKSGACREEVEEESSGEEREWDIGRKLVGISSFSFFQFCFSVQFDYPMYQFGFLLRGVVGPRIKLDVALGNTVIRRGCWVPTVVHTTAKSQNDLDITWKT